MRLIDADEARLQRGFFERVTNVPKFYEWLDSLPTVDAVPVKHGKWETPQRHGAITYDKHAYAECSCCHTPQYLARGMNYCPNCGARMDGEDE